MNHDQPTVFITGVSSGIGYGLTKEYLQRGWLVLGCSRREPDIEHEQFEFASIDVTDESNVKQGLARLIPNTIQLNLAVLNAGVLSDIADMKNTSLEELRRVMDINVWSYKTVLDELFARAEVNQVITMSSGAAINGGRGWGGYSISKAALNMLTQLYARENESTHFAAIAPGLVDTAMQDYLCGHPEDERYPSLEVLKSRRGTEDMPGPESAATRLIPFFERVRTELESGRFADIRTF